MTHGRHRAEDRAQFIGGPFDGKHSYVPIPSRLPTRPYICAAVGRGDWHHYSHVNGNGYVYAGPCKSVHHDWGWPHEHLPDGATTCCCGDPNCKERS